MSVRIGGACKRAKGRSEDLGRVGKVNSTKLSVVRLGSAQMSRARMRGDGKATRDRTRSVTLTNKDKCRYVFGWAVRAFHSA